MTNLAGKLQFKPGMSLLLLHPPDGYRAALEPLPEGVHGVTAGPADAVQLFAGSLADLAREAPGAIAAVRPGGLLWISYPKGTSGIKTDINRDTCWQAMEPLGWRPVRAVAIDDTWSGLRFRPAGDVGR